MKFDSIRHEVIRERVKTPADLVDFIHHLNREVVPDDEEVRNRQMSDTLVAVANWIEESEPEELPDQPDWGFVALLFMAAIYAN